MSSVPSRPSAVISTQPTRAVAGDAAAELKWRDHVAAHPHDVDAACRLGELLVARGEHGQAAAAARAAIPHAGNLPQLHGRLGELLWAAKDAAGAEACFRRAAQLRPRHPVALRKLAAVLHAEGRTEEAEGVYRQVIALAPDDADAWTNLGAALRLRDAVDEADQALARALALQPRHVGARANRAAVLANTGQHEAAVRAFTDVLEDAPHDPQARMNLGMVLLGLGRYAEGWPPFEARYLPRPNRKKVFANPPLQRWQGEDLAGKSLALWFEQGFGDALQFIRYVPLLRARGVTHLTLVAPPVLRPLLQTVPGIDAVVVPGEDIRRHDYWSLLMSLPLHCGTTLDNLPAALPYLAADPQRVARWQRRLPRGPKIGIAWKGSSLHANDRHRSLPSLAALRPLWKVPGISWISLQKGQSEDEALAAPPDQPLLPLGGEIQDFADLAAVVAQLDVVICVDTAVAHLAGALGKPVWVLLPAFAADWRWLQGRTDSPWYPGVMRLFRQARPGDWAPAVRDVATALARGEAWLLQARVLHGEGRIAEAEAAARRALALQPRSAEARTLLAGLRPVTRAELRARAGR